MAEREDMKTSSLEDETSKPKVSKSKLKIPKLVKRQVTDAELQLEEQILNAEVIDDTVVEQPNGIYQVQWLLVGMDCPDCASKAFNALTI